MRWERSWYRYRTFNWFLIHIYLLCFLPNLFAIFGFVGNDAGTEKYLTFFPGALLDVVFVLLAIRFYFTS